MSDTEPRAGGLPWEANPPPAPPPPPASGAPPGATASEAERRAPAPPPAAPPAPPAAASLSRTDARPTDAPSAPAGSEERRRSATGAWLDRLFGRGEREQPASREASDGASAAPPAADAQRPAGEAPPGTRPAAGPGAQAPPATGPPAPWQPPASREEEERRIQAEVDRREARRQRQQADQGRQTRDQQLAQLEQQERRLRQSGDVLDRDESAKLRDQLDAARAQEQFVTGMVKAYDGATLDPLVLALPEGERAGVVAEMPPGLDGRKQFVERSLQRLEQLWRADEAARLRTNPAFRKEIAAALRGGTDPELGPPPDGPELLTSGSGGRPRQDMNTWLRAHLG